MDSKQAIDIESINLIKHELYKNFHFSEKAGNLNLTQERILMTINNSENESMKSIARKIGLEQGPFSQTVDKLVKLNFLIRVRSPIDRRLVHLHLSEKGQSYANKVQKSMNSHFDKILEVLSDKEREDFIHSLNIIKNTAKLLSEKNI